MKRKKDSVLKLTLFFITSLILSLPGNSSLDANSQEMQFDAQAFLKALRSRNIKKRRSSKKTVNGISWFDWREIWLDLSPDTVLATSQGEPMVYVDEFNQRVKKTYGEDLYDARYRALLNIIDKKMISGVAREEGFKNDRLVIKKTSMAEAEAKAIRGKDLKLEIGDDEARRYYKVHIEDFRLSDEGTRVLFVVKGTRNEAQTIMDRIKKGEPFEKFSFSPSPLPGGLLPKVVRETIFHLEPGQLSEVMETPIGFYIVKLVERNNFNHFKVGLIGKNNLHELKKILDKIRAGEKFENFVTEKEQLLLDVVSLPQKIQQVVPRMELFEVSQPLSTPLGYFLVKLKEQRSDAEIIKARLIKLDSELETEKIVSFLNKNSDLEKVGLEEQEIPGKDLPDELKRVAETLKEKKYSSPVKTRLGYYLVTVQKRSRRMYKPFHAVQKEIKERIKAGEISYKTAFEYYNSHKSHYRMLKKGFLLDFILSETLDQGEKILAELIKSSDEKVRDSVFVKYRKDLKCVSDELLPLACRDLVPELKPGQISPVIATNLGYFILRLKEKADFSYLAFEDVKYDIKSLLGEQTRQRDSFEARMYVTQVEENALARAYQKANIVQNLDSVSDEEAEGWWQENKGDYAIKGLPELQGRELLLIMPGKSMRVKKMNMLQARYRAVVKDLYHENNVEINEDILR